MNPASLTKRTVLGAVLLGLLCTGVALARSDVNEVVYKETFESSALWADNALVATTGGWYAAATDASIVTNLGAHTGLPSASPISPSQGGRASRVLKLNTEGATLTNLLDGATLDTKDIWVDTLVQMVVSEDYPVAISNDVNVKAAVFLNTSSNLVVYHGSFDSVGVDYSDSKFTVITNNVVEPNKWYRLTIALEHTATPANQEAFKVMLDGVAVESETQGYTANWVNEFSTGVPVGGGSWFLSAARRAGGNESGFAKEVQALAFQGTGYIDDLVVTDSDPFASAPSAAYWFLSVASSGSGTVDPVAGVYQLMVGDGTNVVADAADWYRIQSITTNGTAVGAAADLALYDLAVASMPVGVTNEVVVTFHQPSTLSGFGTSAIDASWLDNWGLTESQMASLDDAAIDSAYLLNVDPAGTYDIELNIISIVKSGTTVTVVVELTDNGSPLATTINGEVVLFGRDTMGEFTAGDRIASTALTNETFVGGQATLVFLNADKEFLLAKIQPAP